MTALGAKRARRAIAALPEDTSHGEPPEPAHVYLPRSHLKALEPNSQLVTGMRGAGKTFWWAALQQPAVRRLIERSGEQSVLRRDTKVWTGFGQTPAPDDYPGKDVLKALLNTGVEPRMIWRTVAAQQLATDGDPLRQHEEWPARIRHVENNPETIDQLFYRHDEALVAKNVHSFILFDALDRCADDWSDMYRLVRGLMQTARDIRSYRRLRFKIFLRSDQLDMDRIADFPDASKILSSSVELGWPARELYGLLWHCLINGDAGKEFRTFLKRENCESVRIDNRNVFHLRRNFISNDELSRERFHSLAGQWMGKDRRRGFPYTWIPNHLGDTEKRVSPRSFLKALKQAAEDTEERYRMHGHALHYDSIKRGVQEASKIRVAELKEDYPWVDRAMEPLRGTNVPLAFKEVNKRWRERKVLKRLNEDIEEDTVKLPPLLIEEGAEGVRQDLESLGVFFRLDDGRVNIPDVFRIGYGLGRRGGVRPVR